MAAKRRATGVRPALPAPPQRTPVYPPWYRGRRYSEVQHWSPSVRALVEDAQDGGYRLPIFQRPYVWSDDQIVGLFDSMLSGYHCGSLLVWEQPVLPPSVERFREVEIQSPGTDYPVIVVDGQQRLGAILSVGLSGRWWFDLQTGGITTRGGGAWHVPAGLAMRRDQSDEMFDWYRAHATQHGIDSMLVRDALLALSITLDRSYVSMVRLGRDWTLERVLVSYARLATTGTPMDPAHLAEGLRRAREGAAEE